MENIVLQGGPADGRCMVWNGGDELHVASRPAVIDFSVPTVDPVRFNEVVYRRSLVSRNIFVFQP